LSQLLLVPRPLFMELELVAPRFGRQLCKAPAAVRAPAWAQSVGRQLVFRKIVRFGHSHAKAKSLGIKDLSALERRRSGILLRLPVVQRPKVRSECECVVRPCPWVTCRYHLAIDVSRGAARVNFPDLPPSEMVHSCALDVAEYGGLDLAEVGEMLNVTMERARQIEERALDKIRHYAEANPDQNVREVMRDLIRRTVSNSE
jgi:Sigma-70, region 4